MWIIVYQYRTAETSWQTFMCLHATLDGAEAAYNDITGRINDSKCTYHYRHLTLATIQQYTGNINQHGGDHG